MKSSSLLKIFLMIALIGIPAFSEACDCNQTNLHKITLQLQTESWSTTKTANVIAEIDATLDKGNVNQVRDEIMNKLSKLAAGDWHITSFTHTQNESGLEQIHALAELRLPQNALANMQPQAKTISRPGLNIKISNIDFTPSLDEIENTRNDLRSKIYALVNDEIARLSKIYPKQSYSIHAIDFNRDLNPVPMAATVNYMARSAGASVDRATKSMPMLAVSTKVQMTATVELIPTSELITKP